MFVNPKDNLGAEVTLAEREEMKWKEQETEKGNNCESLEGKGWGRGWVCLRSAPLRNSQGGSQSRLITPKGWWKWGCNSSSWR